MEETNVVLVNAAELVEAADKAQVDVQVRTAKAYPRDVQKSLAKIIELATINDEVAGECFYKLKRKDKDGKVAFIEGQSVRLAEIIAYSWGNLRVQSRIVQNDGKTITAQGVCHDLENNVAFSVEVKRRITDRFGRTYSEDMQVVTGNAASSIAMRNAIQKVIPQAVTKTITNAIKNFNGKAAVDVPQQMARMFSYFDGKGVEKQTILNYFGLEKEEEITAEMVQELRGVVTAINEGDTTIEETFSAFRPKNVKVENEHASELAEKKKTVEKAFTENKLNL